MTDTTNGWRCPPGVPLNPEKDGAHRLRHQVSDLESDALWSCGGTWLDLSGDFSIPHAAAFYDYLGPCLTPDQATALQARVLELEGLVAYLCGRNTDHIQVSLAGNPIVVDALVKRAEAAPEGKKE